MPFPLQADVVGVGLNATDTLIHLDTFPERGAKLQYTRELVQPGGQVASAMAACQIWGLQARYVGKLGEDDAARLHLSEFDRLGVEAHTIQVPAAKSARSLILVDQEGESTVLCRRDEQMTLRPEELSRDWIHHARALLVDGHDTEAATLAACWAHEAKVPVIGDFDAAYPELEGLLRYVDHLIVSRNLPSELTGEQDLPSSLRMLKDRYSCELAAVTLGTEGVLAWDGHRMYHAAAFRVPVVDTTGAGDIFHAAFIFGLLQGWALPARLDFACAAAALNCTAEGARGRICPVSEIEELVRHGSRYPAASFC